MEREGEMWWRALRSELGRAISAGRTAEPFPAFSLPLISLLEISVNPSLTLWYTFAGALGLYAKEPGEKRYVLGLDLGRCGGPGSGE
ncbi:hypothetical protein IE53DRAFT_386090 [Violaceomyces palustris]|uniref:Uncharacterized protein n=1 Tax=Violaceomyces palustris TaxID=1673888 RepID=A0ACD0P062_9BASI|nr:hypothetical protein IE53DRAFT_386090 [Violaceomyces palustris]